MKPDAAMVVTTKMSESLTNNTLTPTTLRSITQIFESEDCLQNIKRLDDGGDSGALFVPPPPPAPQTATATTSASSDASRTYVNLDSKSGWHGGTTTVLTPSKVIPHIAVLIQEDADEDKIREEQEAIKRANMTVSLNPVTVVKAEESATARPRRSCRINNGSTYPDSPSVVIGKKSSPPPPLPVTEKSKKKGSSSSSRSGGRKPRAALPGRRRPGDEDLDDEEFERITVRRMRNKEAAARCRKRRVDLTNSLMEEVEEHEVKKRALEEEIQQLKGQKEELEFILQAHAAHCKLQQLPGQQVQVQQQQQLVVAIKSEPVPVSTAAATVVTADNVVVEAVDAQYSIPEVVQLNNNNNLAPSQSPKQRPATLSLAPSPSSASTGAVTAAEAGIVIETPSTVVPCLAFDSVTTGLTPCAPPVSSIETPTVTLNTPVNCSAQQREQMQQHHINNSSPDYVSL